ncbi:MAG: hypothetical protein RIE73_14310 [Coleofasciculus sp. C1-SOL-03]
MKRVHPSYAIASLGKHQLVVPVSTRISFKVMERTGSAGIKPRAAIHIN